MISVLVVLVSSLLLLSSLHRSLLEQAWSRSVGPPWGAPGWIGWPGLARAPRRRRVVAAPKTRTKFYTVFAL